MLGLCGLSLPGSNPFPIETGVVGFFVLGPVGMSLCFITGVPAGLFGKSLPPGRALFAAATFSGEGSLLTGSCVDTGGGVFCGKPGSTLC